MLLEDHTRRAIIQLRKNEEPTDDLTIIRDALLEAAETDKIGKDPVFRTYLFKTIGSNLANRMAKERSTDQDVSVNAPRHCILMCQLYMCDTNYFSLTK